MSLLHWIAPKDGIRRRPNDLGYAYRIVDENCWKHWLSQIAGYPTADLEVVHRTLRVRDQRPAARLAEAAQKAQRSAGPHASRIACASGRCAVACSKAPSPSRSKVVVQSRSQRSESGSCETCSVTDASPRNAASLQSTGDPVKERVLALVAEKTGYPVDMLDLDLDLEADLGVDTVKQAEVMATIREAYGIVRDDTDQVARLPHARSRDPVRARPAT